jgi:hypothetical protein
VHVLTGQRQDCAASMSKCDTPGRLLHYTHAVHAGRSQVARPAQLLLAWEPAVGWLAGWLAVFECAMALSPFLGHLLQG